MAPVAAILALGPTKALQRSGDPRTNGAEAARADQMQSSSGKCRRRRTADTEIVGRLDRVPTPPARGGGDR